MCVCVCGCVCVCVCVYIYIDINIYERNIINLCKFKCTKVHRMRSNI